MQALRLMVGFVLVVGLASCGEAAKDTATATVMPDVVGRQLDVALSDIKRAGFEDKVEVLGGGTFGVVNESNWQVCEQLPAAGGVVKADPRLTVDRSCGDDKAGPTTSEQPSEAPVEEPAVPDTAKSEPVENLTAGNSSDLAALLAAPYSCLEPPTDGFAAKYQGRTIEFDGNVADMAQHNNYDTRFDFLIYVGDYNENSAAGPSFKFKDVSFSALGFTGPNAPGEVKGGDNLRFVAKVGEYNPDTCLIFLDPISTATR